MIDGRLVPQELVNALCCQMDKWCQFNEAELTIMEVVDLMNNMLDESDPDVRIRESRTRKCFRNTLIGLRKDVPLGYDTIRYDIHNVTSKWIVT